MSDPVVNWEQLPVMLTPEQVGAVYQVSTKTVSRWWRTGQIPQPAVTAGSIRRWDRENLRQHIARRQKLR